MFIQDEEKASTWENALIMAMAEIQEGAQLHQHIPVLASTLLLFQTELHD